MKPKTIQVNTFAKEDDRNTECFIKGNKELAADFKQQYRTVQIMNNATRWT